MASAQTSPDTAQPASKFLFDLTGIDLNNVIADRAAIGKVNPHAGHMALLDAVVWTSSDLARAIGRVTFRGDEYFAPGHFPGKPLFPGVLMVEAGAQLANWVFNTRTPTNLTCALMGIDEARFRTRVVPGQTLYLLLDSVKWTTKRFTTRIQGIVEDSIAFDCTVMGISIDRDK